MVGKEDLFHILAQYEFLKQKKINKYYGFLTVVLPITIVGIIKSRTKRVTKNRKCGSCGKAISVLGLKLEILDFPLITHNLVAFLRKREGYVGQFNNFRGLVQYFFLTTWSSNTIWKEVIRWRAFFGDFFIFILFYKIS